MRRLLFLSLALAFMASPALAGSFTYTSQISGSSYGEYFSFRNRPSSSGLVGVFTYSDYFSVNQAEAAGSVSLFGFYPGADSGAMYVTNPIAEVPGAYDIAFWGIFATTDITFDNGLVTIFGNLTPMNGAHISKTNAKRMSL